MNIKNRCVVAKAEDEDRGVDWESGRCKQQSPNIQYWNCIQYSVINHNGKEYFKRVDMRVQLSHWAVQQTGTTL